MFKRILVPLDGSKQTEMILPAIGELARALKAEVVLLRVYETDFGQVDYFGHEPDFYEAIRANCQRDILAYLSKIRQEHLGTGFPVRILAEEGPVVQTIHCVAEREDADLVVMPRRSRTGLSRVIHGSITAGVQRQVGCSLLLVCDNKGY